MDTNAVQAIDALTFNLTEWQRDGLRMVNIDEVKRAHEALFGPNGVFFFVDESVSTAW